MLLSHVIPSEWLYVAKTSSASLQGVEPQTYILAAIFYITIYRVWLCGKTCPRALELMLTHFYETETREVSFSASYLHQTVDGKKA